jgi:hypothetical protein
MPPYRIVHYDDRWFGESGGFLIVTNPKPAYRRHRAPGLPGAAKTAIQGVAASKAFKMALYDLLLSFPLFPLIACLYVLPGGIQKWSPGSTVLLAGRPFHNSRYITISLIFRLVDTKTILCLLQSLFDALLSVIANLRCLRFSRSALYQCFTTGTSLSLGVPAVSAQTHRNPEVATDPCCCSGGNDCKQHLHLTAECPCHRPF